MKDDKIQYLVGTEFSDVKPLRPYSDIACDFLSTLSQALLADKTCKQYPDVVSFAFWCRKGNIEKLKAEFEQSGNYKNAKLGLGTIFHITPSNVPVNFAFSFVFGLLAGNANIIRVPSKPYIQTDIICGLILQLFKEEKFSRIAKMTVFLRYEQDDIITGRFSADCNARIIWGGDVAIRNIRKLPIPERAMEIVFADRYSFCVMDVLAVMALDADGLKRLAENFYNDTYLMDQNACSSPHLVVWLGNSSNKIKERFWEMLAKIVAQKYSLAQVNAVDKYTHLCSDAMLLPDIDSVKKYGNYVYVVGLSKLQDKMDCIRGKFGYFYEYDAKTLTEIINIINSKYQTLTYFGSNKSVLLDFVISNALSGIDRIVPVGAALDIGVIWDGYDIINTLSRIIDVK